MSSSTQKYQDQENNAIWERNVSDQTLQPYLDARAAITRYTKMPILDPRAIEKTSVKQMGVYNVHSTFNPGLAPWSGYAAYVNRESELRNQIFTLQKCEQSVWIPRSDSEMYSMKPISRPANVPVQPYPGLFKEPRTTTSRIYPTVRGHMIFGASEREGIDPRRKMTPINE